ncbi:MAG: hypothetical protein EOO06_04785 [Chitinophagaceae bacterium]|nr:MAG: hypothetical protein EOO06_04785 [Chitinophagaceae bacterium]
MCLYRWLNQEFRTVLIAIRPNPYRKLGEKEKGSPANKGMVELGENSVENGWIVQVRGQARLRTIVGWHGA